MPRRMGDLRHNPHRVIDTWIYKVKDVLIDRMDYVERGKEEVDEKGYLKPDHRDEPSTVYAQIKGRLA